MAKKRDEVEDELMCMTFIHDDMFDGKSRFLKDGDVVQYQYNSKGDIIKILVNGRDRRDMLKL